MTSTGRSENLGTFDRTVTFDCDIKKIQVVGPGRSAATSFLGRNRVSFRIEFGPDVIGALK